MSVETVALGAGGPQVSRVGLGLMGMPGSYGPADEGSLELRLGAGELAAPEAAVPPGEVAGDRYDAGSMAALDSEPAPG